jgi:hypothetical protein
MIAIGALATVVVALVATSISTAAAPVKVADLLAGQNTDAGDIFASTDGTTVTIQLVLDSGWCMSESHVAAASSLNGIPHNKTGSPTPGTFPKSKTYSPCEQVGDTFTFPVSGTGGVTNSPFIAVHAVLWNEANKATTQTVVSKPGVTALAVGGTAVASTEPGVGVAYPECPLVDDDLQTSLWDSNAKLPGNVTPNWGGADWIWNEAYPSYPKNVTGEVVDFSDAFTIPAGLPIIDGSLMITGDNAYRAAVNGGTSVQAQLGPGFPVSLMENVGTGPQDGQWGVASQGWQSVETHTLGGLKVGANTLAITAANEYLSNGTDPAGPLADSYLDAWDPSGGNIVADQDGNDRCINPAGLIYKLSVERATGSGATGWGGGTGSFTFAGGNWATYLHPTLIP